MCVYMHPCVLLLHVFLCAHVCRSWRSVPSIFLNWSPAYLRYNLWTWSFPVWLDCLASKPQAPSCHCPAPHLDNRWICCTWIFYMGYWVSELRSWACKESILLTETSPQPQPFVFYPISFLCAVSLGALEKREMIDKSEFATDWSIGHNFLPFFFSSAVKGRVIPPYPNGDDIRLSRHLFWWRALRRSDTQQRHWKSVCGLTAFPLP